MKKGIAGIILFLFGIGCGFGAFLMLNKGVEVKKTELKKIEIEEEVLEEQEQAILEEKIETEEQEAESKEVIQEENVPNFGTQQEIQQNSTQNTVPKTEDSSHIWTSSVLMGISLAVIGICVESLKKGVRLI